MKTVYKYELPIPGTMRRYAIPLAAQVVMVGIDPNGVPCFWCELHTEQEKDDVRVSVVGTGERVHYGERHIGSFVTGACVWHVYSPDIGRIK